ncbi:GNAT family N-acyltransferase [Herbaspirillum sp.]|uniref:N-acyl amino acid synthase FeeM domain-containing protein n=1 Tax=Herbaspirillum sp. TaxID=1890675 RepID=UPI001B1F02B0|nr:GNAT family N-acyltransferase [Herbaspirillum sp.]MBO9537889.1 GNAT family N-acetyltransferase [Herbaspirillum sp.]
MESDNNTGEPTPRDDVKKLFPVLFVFFSFANMIVCLGLVMFVQHSVAYMLCALLYAVLIATELHFHIKSPISVSMLGLYVGIIILDYFTEQYQGYGGVIIFAWLSLISGLLLLFGMPFTTFYSKGRGIKQLHYTISTLWFVVYTFSLMTSALLIPHVSFLIVPYLLCIGCGFLTIFFNFVWFGKRNELQPYFLIGDLSFRKITPHSTDFNRFCHFYAQQTYHSIDDGSGKTKGEIVDDLANHERQLEKVSHIFIAEHKEKIIGCIRCIVDKRNSSFSMEKDMQLSFDPLRRIGKILYVGRLAVDPIYRDRPDVLNGLFKCFAELALSKDISFVVAESFASRLPTYLKLGFEILFDRSRKHHAYMSENHICHPVCLNFSKLIVYRNESYLNKYQFSEFINKYLAERWYKRIALWKLFKPSSRWPWRISFQQIQMIL